MENGLVNLSTNTLTIPKFKNDALNAETTNIVSIFNRARVTALDLNRELAIVLDRIQTNQLYKEDGFKSLAEYAETIGIKKSNAHALASAGHVYNDEKAPQALKALSPSNIATLSSVLKDDTIRDIVYTDAENGKFNNATQEELKRYSKEKRESKTSKSTSKPKIVPEYTAISTLREPITIDNINGERKEHAIYDEWKEYLSNVYTEYIELPSLKLDKPNSKSKTTVKRALVLDESGEPTVIQFTELNITEYTKKNETPNMQILLERIKTKLEYEIELNEAEHAFLMKIGKTKEDILDSMED